MKYHLGSEEQLTLPGLADQEERVPAVPSLKRKAPAKPASELAAIPYLVLDLSCGHVDLFGSHYWELRSPYREGELFLNTGPAPREPIRTSLSDILEPTPAQKYYLSQTACLGILRRAKERGKELPHQLKAALTAQAGLARQVEKLEFTPGELTVAFAANQRDEVRDLHDVAGALSAQPGMKQQTFVAGITAKGNGDCFLSEERHTALSGGGGMPGQGYPAIFTAAFSAGAGASAGSIGYGEEVSPTLKGTASGNCMPSILCLNDQGGSAIACSENVAGTLRAQEHGHQPLVFENHGIDARYTGPHSVAPTMSARYGTGGNNVPLVAEPDTIFCITGNAIDRQPMNGGNGIGYQQGIAYTLTATDHHAVFSRQRVDVFKSNEVVSTQSARQHKDATDLVVDMDEPDNSASAPRGASVLLIRRLTPLECERLQGFPDGWTDIEGASDSARYKALGNSVAIPCVDYVLQGIAWATTAQIA